MRSATAKTVKALENYHPSLVDQIEEIKMYVRAVAEGHEEMQLICSIPGLGKSHLVTQELKKCGIKVNCQNPDNVHAFVQSLWDHKHEPVIVFDDCEKLLRNEAIANIAKQAFGPTREVVHFTKRSMENEALLKRETGEDEDDFENRKRRYNSRIPKTKFKIKCRLIMLSNIDWTDTSNVSPQMLAHVQALESRGLDPVWIDTSNETDLFLYSLNLAPKMASDFGVKLVKTHRAIDWIIKNRNHLREITPRAVFRIIKKFKTFDETISSIRSMLVPNKVRDMPEIVPPKFIRQNEWEPAKIKTSPPPQSKAVAAPKKKAAKKLAPAMTRGLKRKPK